MTMGKRIMYWHGIEFNVTHYYMAVATSLSQKIPDVFLFHEHNQNRIITFELVGS